MLIVRGVGMGMLFIPITTLALSTLKGKEIGLGASFTGMMRQLGGSFGIALITTYMSQQVVSHRSNLLRYLTPENPAFQARMQGTEARMLQNGMGLQDAKAAALRAMDGTVTRQASILSYMDVFLAIGLVFLFCVPFVLLIKQRAGKVDKEAMAAASH